MTNRDGNTAKERAECADIIADDRSTNRDVKAAQQKLADLNRDLIRRGGQL